MAVKSRRTRWRIDDPIFTRNLVILPVCNGHMGGDEWMTLGEGLEKGVVELLETGDVNRVRVVTPPEPFVVMDGEEIAGARQDRMFVTSFFTRERKTVEAPVACVEAYRWHGGGSFRSAPCVAPPSVRATTQASLYARNNKPEAPLVDQRSVWGRVHMMLKRTGSLKAAPTESMLEGQNARKAECRRYRVAPLLPKSKKEYSHEISGWLDDIPVLGRQIGAIFFASGLFLGMDVMASPSLFSRMYDRLLEGAALEALALEESETPTHRDDIEKEVRAVFRFARSFRRWSPCPAIGEGRELRRHGRKFLGKVLLNGAEVIHLSVHPKTLIDL